MTDETPYTRKFRKELMAGLSSLVLLAVLARAGREMYGYEIAKAVKAEGEGGLIFKQGAIYPVLRSLKRDRAAQQPGGSLGVRAAAPLTTTSPMKAAKRWPIGKAPGTTCANSSTTP